MSETKQSQPTMEFEEINSPEFLDQLLTQGPAGSQAFTRMVRASHDRFLSFIRRQLTSSDECMEVLQEVYLAVHKGLPSFAGKSKLTTWIYSLAHHKICDRIADKDRQHHELQEKDEAGLTTDLAGSDKWAGITAWDSAPDRLAARNAVEGLIAKAIESLPDNARQVYHLRDVEGMPGDEAAEILGITSENVRVQLHRARRQIVDWVQEKMSGVKNA